MNRTRPASPWAAAPLACSLLAFVLGCLFVYPRQWTRGFLISDEAWYAQLARNLLEKGEFVTETLFPMFARQVESLPMQEPMKQIGYPLIVALVANVTGLSDQLFIAVALVGLALTGWATWLVTHAIVNDRHVATVISLATVGNPILWSSWTAAFPESLFTALFLGALWLLLQEDVRDRVLAGVLLAVSVYFKAYAVIYLPVAGLFVLLFSTRTTRMRHLAALIAGATITFIVATVLLPLEPASLGDTGVYASNVFLYDIQGITPVHAAPMYDLDPPNALTYILAHPLDYLEKVARMVFRTKQIVETLGGPAFGGVLFPLLLLLGFSVTRDVTRAYAATTAGNREEPTDGQTGIRFLIVGLLVVNFAFFWAGNFKERYFAHLFPLILAGSYIELNRLVPDAEKWRRAVPRVVAVLLAVYFLVFPPAIGLWKAYRDPYAYLGRNYVVRWASYQQISETIMAHVPSDGMVVTDMAHAVTWYADRSTGRFPVAESQLSFIIDKFDVVALHEHPNSGRDWAVIRQHFRLVDDSHGRLWVRR